MVIIVTPTSLLIPAWDWTQDSFSQVVSQLESQVIIQSVRQSGNQSVVQLDSLVESNHLSDLL